MGDRDICDLYHQRPIVRARWTTYYCISSDQVRRLSINVYQVWSVSVYASPAYLSPTDLLRPLEHIQSPILERLPSFRRFIVLDLNSLD